MFHTSLTTDAEKLTPDDAELVDVIHSGGRWIGMDGVVIILFDYFETGNGHVAKNTIKI